MEGMTPKQEAELRNVSNISPLGEPPYVLSRGYVNNILVEMWSDGFCVQSGYVKAGTLITFPQPYVDTNYNICTGICSKSSDTQPTELKIAVKSKTQLQFNQAYNGNTTYNAASYEWRTAGFTK